MLVTKRDGKLEEVDFNKITERLLKLADGLNVDVQLIARETIGSLYDKISTYELDQYSAKIAEEHKMDNFDYSILAARILRSNIEKISAPSFSIAMKLMIQQLPRFSNMEKYIEENGKKLDAIIQDYYEVRAFIPYIGLRMLEENYLVRINGVLIERPEYMFMREAITVSTDSELVSLMDIDAVYSMLVSGRYTHATPTLFNACANDQQLASCFILGSDDDTREIMRTVSNASIISKFSGGIGIPMSNIRSASSLIKTTGGYSSGLPKQLKIYDACAQCWDQGGKRPGSIAVYLEMWHSDIIDFLEMKLPSTDPDRACRNLFYGLWISDLFVKRVLEDKDWSLFNFVDTPGLDEVYDKPESADFTWLYEKYESEGRAVQTIKARKLLDYVLTAQRETGTPYVCFKDHINCMNMQSNIGVIKSSNLCAEIMEYTDKNSYASCTLASINLRAHIVDGLFDTDKLIETVKTAVGALDNVISKNIYPVNECISNAQDLRPIGLGIQGLADMFAILDIDYHSVEAEKLEMHITETIYWAACEESMLMAKYDEPYKGFWTSDAAKGILHFDKWIARTEREITLTRDWALLKKQIQTFGLRNSLLIAYMPTVSTSQLFGNCESFEPFSDLVYTKTTKLGKFIYVNEHLARDIKDTGLNYAKLVRQIGNGDVSGLSEKLQKKYKTVWDISQSYLMERASNRSAFIDQSQSLNIYLKNNSTSALYSVFIKAWKLHLKTGSYYIRTRPASKPMNAPEMCTRECVSCSA